MFLQALVLTPMGHLVFLVLSPIGLQGIWFFILFFILLLTIISWNDNKALNVISMCFIGDLECPRVGIKLGLKKSSSWLSLGWHGSQLSLWFQWSIMDSSGVEEKLDTCVILCWKFSMWSIKSVFYPFFHSFSPICKTDGIKLGSKFAWFQALRELLEFKLGTNFISTLRTCQKK